MAAMLRRPFIALAACVAALVLPMAAQAQDAYFGPQIGVFIPRSEVLRNALGETWLSFGASRVRVFKSNQGKIAYDWNAVGQRNDGSNLFILTGSIGYVIPFAPPGAGTQPYVAIRGGLAYIDYAVDTPSGRESGKVLSPNGNAAFGINFNNRVNLEVRYDVWSSYEGLTFDGISVALRVGLFRF